MAKKVKILLCACLVCLATLLGCVFMSPVTTNADTLSSTVFQTDGASVRVFKATDTGYEATDRKGIRFHVEMGAGYLIPNTQTPLLDTTAEKNANGSYKMAEGYKSYTLVLPTRLMGGSMDLTMDLDKVMKIDTTEYWFNDADGNWESVAYIYNIPEKWYTDEFTYRGIVVKVDGETETPVMWTEMNKRILAWVAKQAYNDTIDEKSNYWGTAEQDKTAAPLIKEFIPTYTITYKENGATEEVFWGDKIVGVNAEKTYYDETNHEPIDVTKPLTMATSTNIVLNGTEVSSFVFTGVQYTPNGFNVYATLPTAAFGHDIALEPSAVDMVTEAGNVVQATSVKVHVTGTGNDAVSQLQIGFSYENITNGTKLTMLDTSHFYNNGILYELMKDYTFEYYNNSWELPLGQITLADFKTIKNYTETVNDVVEHNVRITFNRDFLVNGGAEFKTADGQPAAVTITCPDNNNEVKKTISDGYYYWNQGQVSILEIPGPNGGNFWGEHRDDVMTIPAGTRVYQNNGYYLVSEEITATFNGGEDWLFSPEYHEIDASHFLSAYTRQEGDSIYIDVKTNDRWASDCVEVVCNDGVITYNHTDNVTKHELTKVFYHGENNNQILRLYIHDFSETGDWVTIPAGTQLWIGNDVYKLTEDVTSYFVDTKQWNEGTQKWDNKGSTWITNPTLKDITKDDFTSIGWYQSNIRFETKEVWSSNANNKVIMDDTYINGDGVVAVGTNYSGFYYYGATNSLLEMQGVNFSEAGGSVTLKEGVYFWLFNNKDFGYVSGYRLAEDIVIEVSGANGSQIYKDTEVLSITKADIDTFQNDGSHSGEIRVFLTDTKISNMYGVATVEGSATLNGEATSSAFIYGGDGTSGYSGKTIIAFTGENFGRAFQATAKGDEVKIAAGTKVWLSNGSGYVTFADELIYVWNGSAYVPQTEHTLTINSAGASVTVNGTAVTAPMTVKTGAKVTFTVEVPAGSKLASVSNATLVAQNDNLYAYTTDCLFGDVTVLVACSEPIMINQSSVENLIAYYNAENATDFEGFRLQLKETDAINAVATKYGGVFEGTIEMKVGTTTAPTTFHYYGDGNRMIAIGCDISGMQAGDYMTIKAGSIFIYGEGIFLVESDIKILTITANFNESVNGFSVKEGSADAVAMDSGKPLAKLAGTELTFTYGWQNGSESTHTLAAVRFNGVDMGNSGTYNVTLTEATTIDVVTFVATDIANTMSIENWATQDGEDFYFFAIKASGEEYIYAADQMKDKYWNDQAANIKGYNHGVDLMEYIYVNGKSVREIVTANQANNQYTGTTFPFSASGIYAPITVETGADGSAGVWMKIMKAYASELEITVKKGFTVVGANGNNYYVSKDVTVMYANGSVGSKNNTAWIGATNATVSGVTDGQGIVYGQAYSFTVSASTGYNLTSVKINDVEQGTSGSYSFTASNSDVTIIVTTAPKTYTATVRASNASVSGISNNQSITHGQTYSFTVSASRGYAISSVKINNEEQGTSGSYSFTASGATSIVVETKKTYTVTASCSGGVSVSNTPQTVMEGGSVTFTLNVPSNATIKANGAQISGTSYTVSNVTANTTITFTTWYTVKVSTSNGAIVSGISNGDLVESGTTISFTASDSDGLNSVKINGTSMGTGGSYSYTVTGPTTITVEGKCLVEGTMVLMADGTQKAVENIVAGDKVMVFNHETGKYEAGTIWFNDHADDPAELRKIINLEFANGVKTRIAYEHGYFDLDLMRYVFIREDNMHEFIGHRFVTSMFNGTEVVQSETTLVKAYITEEVVKVYGPITEYHFNLVTDDMLSMPSFNFEATGMVNIFEYDADLSYNEEKMQADIEKYGVFTYEEFSEYMSYEDYCKAPIQYFKVAIGKGNLTWEQIELTLQYLAVNEF